MDEDLDLIYAPNTSTIPCDKCNQQIASDQYETHQLLHLDDTTPSTLAPFNPATVVECKYADCSTKWIPHHEYADHLALHQLQAQQVPNTANDELIAFNHQTQLLQQQTAAIHHHNNNTSGSIPDPRRICLSPSFAHLSGTQRPVIPLHDALQSRYFARTRTQQPSSNSHEQPLRDNHNVNGIIEAIDHVLSSKSHLEYYLCDPLQFFYRDREDYSWGCGFRNMQTLTSSLVLHKDVYSQCLFNAIGYVPRIEQLQRYLDYAHAQGFDPEGLKELGQTEGKRVWIGAVDVVAVLRSFDLPAAIFDFQLSSTQNHNQNNNNNNNHNNGSQQELYHNDLFDWVWDYFRQRYQYHGVDTIHTNSGNNRGQPTISSYFQAANTANMNSNASNAADGGVFDDEDSMLQHALELSKQDMHGSVAGVSEINENGQTATENGQKRRKGCKRKHTSSKMEMDDDSDSGSSFSDEVEVDAQDKDDDDGDDEEEEKKSDENEDDLFYLAPTHRDNKDKGLNKLEELKAANKAKSKENANSDSKEKRFIPPLYFQHQGHSRTIIGILHNKRSGLRHLLVLDPSVKKGAINLLNTIKNGNVSVLYRSLKQITSAKYQIVAIPAYGVMTNDDRNRCKTIQSMDVTLINKLNSNASNF